MKQAALRKFIVFNVFAFVLFSCSKNGDARRDPPSPPPPPSLINQLQHTWIFESLDVYSDSALSGQRFPGIVGNGSDFFYFSHNEKLYSVMVGSIDSANYKLRADSTLLVNQYYGGVASVIPDTVSIRVLTSNSLILARRNEAGEWGKFKFKR